MKKEEIEKAIQSRTHAVLDCLFYLINGFELLKSRQWLRQNSMLILLWFQEYNTAYGNI